ncbi:hypothetical protein K440DRAFT_318525 [Wilcoxina mikolae CBS 423.85]|nr:hypothetical protein K440DRAFT_318525 [Wilcoxina mikolae CBS 423.85]
MFALRSRTAIRCARAPLETVIALRRPATARAVFSTSIAVRKPEVDAAKKSESGPRIPLSIQANYYEPLRRTPTHGYTVCDLQLRSYSVRNLEFMCDFALRAAYYANLPASGPVPLPKKIERWTVPRGNFVHKKSQENFQRITYKRLIQIKDGSPETVELWLAFLRQHQFHGVGMKANVWNWEEIGTLTVESFVGWREPHADCAIGVGKKMNVSLETLRDDVHRPKWAHFGPRKSSGTAAMVQEILNSPEYKALEENFEELPVAETTADPVNSEQKSEQPATQTTADTSEVATEPTVEAEHEPIVSEQVSEQPATGLHAEPVPAEEVAAADATAEPVPVPAEEVAATAESIKEQTLESATAEKSPVIEEISSEELAIEVLEDHDAADIIAAAAGEEPYVQPDEPTTTEQLEETKASEKIPDPMVEEQPEENVSGVNTDELPSAEDFVDIKVVSEAEAKVLEAQSDEPAMTQQLEETVAEVELQEAKDSELAAEEVKLSEKAEEPALKEGALLEKAEEIVSKVGEATVSETAEEAAAEEQVEAKALEETKESAPKEEEVKSKESIPKEGEIKIVEESVTKEQTEDLNGSEKTGESAATIHSDTKSPVPEKK